MNFEFDNNIPIYIQLVEQLKIYIISGNIDLGEKLPSVRDLSISFKVNPNTMQRALGELEELGLIYTKRTSGKFVTEDKDLVNRYKGDHAINLAKKYFSSMRIIGLNKEEMIKYIERLGGDE